MLPVMVAAAAASVPHDDDEARRAAGERQLRPRKKQKGRHQVASTHVIVLPGGGYAEHAPHEAEPVARWLTGTGVSASVFRYPLNVRHPAPLQAVRAEISRLRGQGVQRIGLMGFSAGGHLAGLAALAPGAAPEEAVQFAVLGYAITSMETETYRPSRLILLGEDASPRRRAARAHLPPRPGPRRGRRGGLDRAGGRLDP